MATNDDKVVLVADDDQDIRSLLKLIFEDEGYVVVEAANGMEALEAVQRQVPDLILLDMGMPVMGGREFARELRARHDRRIPIVVLSATDYDRALAEEMCVVRWVEKPFDLDAIVGLADQIIARGYEGCMN